MVPIEDVENLSFEDFVKCGIWFSILFIFRCIVWFVSFFLRHNFYSIVAHAFQAQFSDGFGELKICDQLDTPIKDLSALKYAINVWAKSGCFYLKVDFQQRTSESITSAVTPVQLFLIASDSHKYFFLILSRRSKAISFAMKAIKFWLNKTKMVLFQTLQEQNWWAICANLF